MKTCDTCKWWGVSPVSGQPPGVSDFFEKINYKECGALGSLEPDSADVDGFEMGSMPEIVTGPKFGCIHHEEKNG